MRAKLTFISLAALAATYAIPAHACRSVQNESHLLHRAVPTVPEDAFVAEVAIVSTKVDLRSPVEIEARVLKVIQGEFTGERVKIRLSIVTSCSRFPDVGATGVLVGHVREVSAGEMEIDPIFAHLTFDEPIKLPVDRATQ